MPEKTSEMSGWQKSSEYQDRLIDLEANFTPAAASKNGEMLEVNQPLRPRDADSHSD